VAGLQRSVRQRGGELVEDEEVVLHGLVAKCELNGSVAVIAGRLNEGGRCPTKLCLDDDLVLAAR